LGLRLLKPGELLAADELQLEHHLADRPPRRDLLLRGLGELIDGHQLVVNGDPSDQRVFRRRHACGECYLSPAKGSAEKSPRGEER
jgi:hypothetical protein